MVRIRSGAFPIGCIVVVVVLAFVLCIGSRFSVESPLPPAVSSSEMRRRRPEQGDGYVENGTPSLDLASSALEAIRQGSWPQEPLINAADSSIGPAAGQLLATTIRLAGIHRVCAAIGDPRAPLGVDDRDAWSAHGVLRWWRSVLPVNSSVELVLFLARRANLSASSTVSPSRLSTGATTMVLAAATAESAVLAMLTAQPGTKCDLIAVLTEAVSSAAGAIMLFSRMRELRRLTAAQGGLFVVTSDCCGGATSVSSSSSTISSAASAVNVTTHPDTPSNLEHAIAEHQRRHTMDIVTRVNESPGKTGVTLLQFTSAARRHGIHKEPLLNDALRRIALGSWRSVDLAPYDTLGLAIERFLSARNASKREGSSLQLTYERQLYVRLAQMPNVRRICEIGFNAGHSAALWLLANPRAEVLMFDLWAHDYAPLAEYFLRSKLSERFGLSNVSRRFRIIKGSSLITVPAFFSAFPSEKCDLLSVDGGHSHAVAVADISNMRELRNRRFHVLVVDDTNCQQRYCVDAAIAEHERRGTVTVISRIAERHHLNHHIALRGVTTLQYL